MDNEQKTVPEKTGDTGPKVRVAGKGKTKSMPFVAGNTVSHWATQAGKPPEGDEKYFIGQEECSPDFVVAEPVTITIGTEASNGF